jgi:hypothetical protein
MARRPSDDAYPVQEPYAIAVFTRRPVRVGHVKKAIAKLGAVSDERIVFKGR